MKKFIQQRDNIPPSLAERSRFFVKDSYKKTALPKGWNDSQNWGMLDDIPPDKSFGMAITDTDLALIDGDHIIDATTGAVIPEAQAVLDRILQYGDTYTEYSMSGTGIHLIIDIGDYAESFPSISNGSDQIILLTMKSSEYEALSDNEKSAVPKFEMFYHVGGRYVALTGNCTEVHEVARDEIAAAMLRECLKMVDECHDATPKGTQDGEPKFTVSETDRKRIYDALHYIRSDDRETWIRVGMALFNCGISFKVWDKWSQHSEKYNDGKDEPTAKKWEGFKRNSHNWNIGTILRLAKANGWNDSVSSDKPPDQGDKHIENGIKEHNANKGTNALIVKPMSAYEIKPTEFLFKPYFPLKVVIVSAYPGSGKTYVGCKLAASVSKGIDFAKCKNLLPERRKVIYFSSEDGYEDTIGLRLMECHADMDNVLSVEFDDSDSLDFSDGRLETLIKQEEPALIIFDTLQNFIGNVNMNAANETTAKMRALVRLADQYKCCIVLIAHFNKNELGSAITRTIGSTDIVGKCRSYLCVGSVPDEDNTKFLSHEKCNVAQLGDTILFSITPDRGGITFTGTSTLKADDYAVSKRVKGKPSPELDTVKDFIVRNMPGGNRESKEMETLCSANNFSMTTVKRAKKMLGIRSVKEGKAFADATWYWQAPQEGFCGVNGFSPIDYTKERYDFDDEINEQDEEFHDSG